MTSSIQIPTPRSSAGASRWTSLGLLHEDSGATARRHDAGIHIAKPRTPPQPIQRPSVLLPLEELEREGLLARATSRSDLANQFRRLKLPLVANARASVSRPGFIMITSSVPEEGKTFCAINLALSIAAEVDTSVLLVDTDSEKAGLTNRLKLPARPGLYDLLTQPDLKLHDVALQTNVPRLEVLPAGTPHALPGELLASGAMQRLLGTFVSAAPGCIVVFDSPALLTSSEAPVLARLATQIVLVVAASKTPQRVVHQAIASLDTCDAVFPLLNRARFPAAA